MPRFVINARRQDGRVVAQEALEYGCITEAPSLCEGEKAGKSLVNRGKWGIKRSTVMDARGIPLELVTALADRQDSLLLDQALAANLRLAR